VRKYYFEKLAKTDCGVPVANRCANVLWRWFEGRINKKYAHTKPFNYNIVRIKDVIYDLVIFFGYKFEQGGYDEFARQFGEWLKDLGIDIKSNTWIAPYEVFQMERRGRNLDPKYANITAVVIWDVLLDNGLDTLCRINAPENVLIDENEIYNRINTANAKVLDLYEHYKNDPTIIEKLGLDC